MGFDELNWFAVVAAAGMGFVVGGIWYGPVMGQKWMVAIGLSEDDIQNGHMLTIYGFAFVFSLVASTLLAWIFAAFPELEFVGKVVLAAAIALGFVIPAIGTNYLFSHKSRQLLFIDGAYWLLFYLTMGAVHGLM